ncbi:AfsR/SARP family transcriptional regulator [Streptomyces sp. NPDC050560]|uniref:AfsR/SARP family transcriptional regulator n=1 Tax=Streptomyces sp. NPDC050560 TaxID=3365630 RepID=UPI0037A86667
MNAIDSEVRFAVLGPMAAWRGDRQLELGPPQQQAVLAALLLRRGHPITLGELIDAVWGEEPPTAAVSVLRTYVSRLRRVLEPHRNTTDPPRVIVSVGDGYLIRVHGDCLDLAVFELRLAEARKLRARGEPAAAAESLRAALDEWRGQALAGLPGPLAASERARLEEQRLTTREARLDLDVELGHHDDVIGELNSLAEKHPLRESLSRLLTLALYRAGRQAEALAAYQRARKVLVDELGIEPGAKLRELHARILAADESLAAPPGHQQDPPPPPSSAPAAPAARPAQLPSDLATFVGRSAELQSIDQALSDDAEAPATVVIRAIGGMAGIGKTTLAVRWAHRIADRFPDGQLFINLRGFDQSGRPMTADEAVRIFLDALGVPPVRIPKGLEAQSALYRSMLASRRVLILLDNAHDTEQVRPLLPGAPGCLVIVTSRSELTGLVVGEGARLLTLDQLSFTEARDLLSRRLGPERLAAQPQAVDELITRCARLPLALAIVAAHAAARPAFPLSAIVDEVRESHGSLDAFSGRDGISTDVRAVFSWSYQALSAPAARLFRLLGLHSGPDICAHAAAALAGLTVRQTRELLSELTRAHLLAERFPTRYTSHDLLRAYAVERVGVEETPEDRDRAVDRMLAWYLHTAAATCSHLTPRRHKIPMEALPEACNPLEFATLDQALNWCETERANLVAAVHQAAATGRASTAWRLSAVLWGYFYLRSLLNDWLDTSQTALAAARASQDTEGTAQALTDVAAALRLAGRVEETILHLRQALDTRRELGDVKGTAIVFGNLGDAHIAAGRVDEAVGFIRQALALHERDGNAWGYGIGLSNLGDAYQQLGRFPEAIETLEHALTVLRTHGNPWVEGVALDTLGTVHQRLHQYDEAIVHYRLALETHRNVSNRWGEGHSLGNLGEAQLAVGDREAARASWERALSILAEFDHADAEKMRERFDRLENADRVSAAPAPGGPEDATAVEVCHQRPSTLDTRSRVGPGSN